MYKHYINSIIIIIIIIIIIMMMMYQQLIDNDLIAEHLSLMMKVMKARNQPMTRIKRLNRH